MLWSSSWALTPRPTVIEPWGSKSTSSTLRPVSTRAAPRLMVVVVLPTPPFWLHIAMIVAGCPGLRGWGLGKFGIGLPVGPSSLLISYPCTRTRPADERHSTAKSRLDDRAPALDRHACRDRSQNLSR